MRIIGLREVKSTGDNGQRNFEDYNQSIERVLSVASEMGCAGCKIRYLNCS